MGDVFSQQDDTHQRLFFMSVFFVGPIGLHRPQQLLRFLDESPSPTVVKAVDMGTGSLNGHVEEI
jgi:hypothetical protein